MGHLSRLIFLCSEYPLKASVKLSNDVGSEVYARLLVHHMDEQFSECIQQIRDDAYNAGYRDGRHKKAKRYTGFNTLTFRYGK